MNNNQKGGKRQGKGKKREGKKREGKKREGKGKKQTIKEVRIIRAMVVDEKLIIGQRGRIREWENRREGYFGRIVSK